jgi:hypothetical protein
MHRMDGKGGAAASGDGCGMARTRIDNIENRHTVPLTDHGDPRKHGSLHLRCTFVGYSHHNAEPGRGRPTVDGPSG